MEKNLIFGRNPVLEYIRDSQSGNSNLLYVSKGAHGKIIDQIVADAKGKKIKTEFKEKSFFASLVSSSKHQGVALKITSTETKETKSEKEILENTVENNGIIVLLDQLTDPHNVGSIIRSAEALGAYAVVIPKNNSSDINSTVIKSSAGATTYINILTVSNVSSFMDRAKKTGLWVVGTSDHATKNLEELKSIKPALLIIGSEGKGMRKLTEEKCDFTIKIPLKGKISSLNASVAAGIAIYSFLKD